MIATTAKIKKIKILFWLEFINITEGNYTSMEKNKMSISWQSFEGLQIIVYYLIEGIQFLLNSGFKFILTSNSNQDDSENYFSKQHRIGHCRDNPTVFAVGNVIVNKFSIQPSSGNIS